MKHIRGLKPTRQQAKTLQRNSMDAQQWLIHKVLPDRFECIHRITGQIKPAFYEVVRI